MTSESSPQSGIVAAVGTLFKQFGKNVEQLPGWVPLLICYQLGLANAPKDATYLGISIDKHRELLVGVLTFLSYQFGDAIDKPLFKNFEGSWLDRRDLPNVREAREKLQGTLGIRGERKQMQAKLAQLEGVIGKLSVVK